MVASRYRKSITPGPGPMDVIWSMAACSKSRSRTIVLRPRPIDAAAARPTAIVVRPSPREVLVTATEVMSESPMRRSATEQESSTSGRTDAHPAPTPRLYPASTDVRSAAKCLPSASSPSPGRTVGSGWRSRTLTVSCLIVADGLWSSGCEVGSAASHPSGSRPKALITASISSDPEVFSARAGVRLLQLTHQCTRNPSERQRTPTRVRRIGFAERRLFPAS